MVSAQLKTTNITLGFRLPSGEWMESLGQTNVQVTGAGGSSDGTIATAQAANTAWRLPITGPVAYAGCSLNLMFILAAASAVDKSDGIMLIPITIKDLKTGRKSVRLLQNTDFGTATDVASGDFGIPMQYGLTGWVVPSGMEVRFGADYPNNAAFISIESGA